jgi:hypothetical protein
MKQITLNIPDNKYTFFMELVKNLSFIKVTNAPKISPKLQQFVTNLKDSLNQVEQHIQGKIKLKTADQLLNEL